MPTYRDLSFVLLLFLTACGGGGGASPSPTPTPATPEVVTDVLNLDFTALLKYAPTLPNYYDAEVLATNNTPATPAASDAIATLGRVLFYDKNLSANNTIACASSIRLVMALATLRALVWVFQAQPLPARIQCGSAICAFIAPAACFGINARPALSCKPAS